MKVKVNYRKKNSTCLMQDMSARKYEFEILSSHQVFLNSHQVLSSWKIEI